MFSVVFPGQGSQTVGMGKEFYNKYSSVKQLFDEANDTLKFDLTKLIFEGPKNDLDLTINTQPAIFLISYSIFKVIKEEHNINLHEGSFFAGHSLGEYSALACAGNLNFSDTIKILKLRGEAMQNSIPKGTGGMVAILGTTIENIENILRENKNNFTTYIANDNSEGQIVVSGKLNDLEKMIEFLKLKKIKCLLLPVSAPFHCPLMKNATEAMIDHINNLNFNNSKNKLISNVTAKTFSNEEEVKKLLIQQIESRVRWREIILNMIDKKIKQYIEIGPGKVLSGLIKRIDKDVNCISINNEEDIKKIGILNGI